eukprot:Seg7984.1 transcript_id=Seg7984.1/GoldUCD/mRNA.D3Y31 product="hypothetical protein" protein_id=Seg7984.1/GoldUCD/D3Y31
MYCWSVTGDFIVAASELLGESLEKHGGKEFREAVADKQFAPAAADVLENWTKHVDGKLTFADVWTKYNKLKHILRFKEKTIEYDVDPYHTPESKELMEAYRDIHLHSTSGDDESII